ncbi:MAG: helix-turn-helix domain-containing protein [Verrucomicrobiota bacterium]
MDSETTPAGLPPLSFTALSSALGSPVRWKLLREVAMGDGLIIVELAERLGLPASNASKHMRVLRDCGLVVVNRAGNHQITRGRLVSKNEGIVECGCCLLRLARKP